MKNYVSLALLALFIGCQATPTTTTALRSPKDTANQNNVAMRPTLAQPGPLTTLPPMPPMEKATSPQPPGTYSLTLDWDQSPDARAIGYNLYYGGASQTYTNKIQVTGVTNTTATVPNLLTGPTYYFAATTVATNGLESSYSAEISYASAPPLTNTAVTITALSATNINGPWSIFTNMPAATLLNPKPAVRFFRLSITSTNF